MKRTDFVKLLKNNGWYILRDKGPHTVYTNGIDCESVPRHKELKEPLVKAIIKRRNLK